MKLSVSDRTLRWCALLWLLSSPMLGCETSGGAAGADQAVPPGPQAPAKDSRDVTFSPEKTATRLVIVHTSDNESDLLGHRAEGQGDAAWGGIARATALLRALTTEDADPKLILAAGDTMMPAPELKVDLDGKNAVAESNNLLGYQASALGNHEFDLGEAFLADFIRQTRFPYLSATLDFEGGPLDEIDVEADELTPDNTWLAHHPGRILPRGKLCAGGELTQSDAGQWTCSGLTVGVVGATTETLRTISNISEMVKVADGLDAIRRRVQQHVDALVAEGVDHIVLLSHLQDVNREVELVDLGLVGVDVIIAGGGDNRLADPGDRLVGGEKADPVCAQETTSCYPILRRARDGSPVAIVATDGSLRYLGHLAVTFDARGVLTGFETTSSRPWPVDEESLVEARAEPVREALSFETRLRDTLAPLLQPFAYSDVFLNGTREGVRNRETNLANLSCDAMLWGARGTHPQAGFALRNGGGIRAPIGSVDRRTYALKGSPLRPLDLQNAFRFDNPVVVVDATHEVVRQTFESGLRGAGTSRGHFPQVSGNVVLTYSTDAPEQTHVINDGKVTALQCSGGRVRDLKVTLADGSERIIVKDGQTVDPKKTIQVATLAYLSRGGDAYFPVASAKLKPVATERNGEKMTEQTSFRAFILELEKQGQWNKGASYADPREVASRKRIVNMGGLADGAYVPPACSAP
jgi:2',3'-cyclic-nucleotide 2'-phosphodiesterase (5'-nucleotidase family)